MKSGRSGRFIRKPKYTGEIIIMDKIIELEEFETMLTEGAYGGDQSDYGIGTWRAYQGCGYVAIANIYAYYLYRKSNYKYIFSKEEFLNLMNEIHSNFNFTIGIPYKGSFIGKFKRFARKNQITVEYVKKRFGDQGSMAEFIMENLKSGQPLALLTLGKIVCTENGTLFTNHWVPITGMKNKDVLIDSSWEL